MQGRKYINLVEIGLAVLEIQKAEFGNFVVPVNSTLVCRTSFFIFLANDTLLCVLISAVANCCTFIIINSAKKMIIIFDNDNI